MSALWIFGYGSLVWRPAFAHSRRVPAYIDGFERRFWQASPLHRGTPNAPGRVATLLAKSTARCWGMAYEVSQEQSETVLAELDHRERTGYERVRTSLHIRGEGSSSPVHNVLLYIASPDNENYIGPEADAVTASIIRTAVGESGENREYLEELAAWLDGMQVDEPHIKSLVACL